MAFPIPVIQTLGDEYNALNEWYGLNRWKLTSRELIYWNGRAIDLLEIVVTPPVFGAVPVRYKVPFDATKIRPPSTAPAGSAGISAPSWSGPIALLLLALGIVWWIRPRKRAWL